MLAWRLENGRRKSALEEGWLLVELAESQPGVSALATMMRRPKSWVSQRLGLVRSLPESVQDAVRSGKIPAQGAMKSLVPMARLDASSCARLVAALPEPVTVRQLARLVTAWRSADATGRERIVAHPGLLLRAEEALTTPEADAEELLARALEGVAALCRRARKAAQTGVFARANRRLVERGWQQASEAFLALQEEIERAQPRDP